MNKFNSLLFVAAMGTTMFSSCDSQKEMVSPSSQLASTISTNNAAVTFEVTSGAAAVASGSTSISYHIQRVGGLTAGVSATSHPMNTVNLSLGDIDPLTHDITATVNGVAATFTINSTNCSGTTLENSIAIAIPGSMKSLVMSTGINVVVSAPGTWGGDKSVSMNVKGEAGICGTGSTEGFKELPAPVSSNCQGVGYWANGGGSSSWSTVTVGGVVYDAAMLWDLRNNNTDTERLIKKVATLKLSGFASNSLVEAADEFLTDPTRVAGTAASHLAAIKGNTGCSVEN